MISESPDRDSAQVEDAVPHHTQSAEERQSAEAHLRTIVEKFAPGNLLLVESMRDMIRKQLPTAYEVVYEYRSWFVISFSPNEHGYEGVFGIRGDANGIKLYFNNGKELPDPAKLLKGSSQARSIIVEDESTLARAEVARLIDEAIARNHVPFALDGDGAVILSESTKKLQRQPT